MVGLPSRTLPKILQLLQNGIYLLRMHVYKAGSVSRTSHKAF
eukprot:COSAG02_NODE_4605_length_5174_cov_18.935961_4_plen_42_part_00